MGRADVRVCRAAWILSIAAPPVRDGWVAVDGDSIVAAGGPADAPPRGGDTIDCGAAAILPGLVNAHVHLELSWMRGQVKPAGSMPQWIDRLMALRRTVGHEPPAPIREAIDEARGCGTSLVGDITNTLSSHAPLLRSGLSACLFRELLGFRVADGEEAVAAAAAQLEALPGDGRVRWSVVPHAPYSVSPPLLGAIAAAAGDRVVSIHVGESAEEMQFLRDGTGPWRELLERLGAWNPGWEPPGCGPVEYLERFGLVGPRMLAVHGVQLPDAEIRRLAAAGATLVTCPRSNVWTGAGVPPVERFYASGVRVAIGTDSLASVADLNLFGELAAVRAAAPRVPAAAILESATKVGAEALGFGQELGTIEPGKRADLVAVRTPPDLQDVEEYLLSGIQPPDISWLNQNLEPEP
jgi:aminodeoxyfutalosine deaminase